MTLARMCIRSSIFALVDMFEDIDEDLFYYMATSSMMSGMLDGMTAEEVYHLYFDPVANLPMCKLHEIVYAEHLDEYYACHIIVDLRASVRNCIVSCNEVGE